MVKYISTFNILDYSYQNCLNVLLCFISVYNLYFSFGGFCILFVVARL